MYEERTAPVKEGEEYDVEIESLGGKGDGIAKVKGFILFVAKTKKGDQVKVKITKVLKNVGFAEVVGKAENIPRREKKFAEIKQEEFEEVETAPDSNYEDTEDFGEEAK